MAPAARDLGRHRPAARPRGRLRQSGAQPVRYRRRWPRRRIRAREGQRLEAVHEDRAKAVARTGVPKYLSSDNDPLFTYHRWLANLRILEIDELKTVPYTPISHPFVERLIGSLRRELLDQVFFWNTVDLERKLRSFQLYFNHSRTHASLDGDTPA
ncbi:MAG: transposase, partial [Proteobacteria bacterium]|nr:transposase [Pseudomonadota bacterium]